MIITKSQWKSVPKDYRGGDPRKGTARVLCNQGGTVLCPVDVLPDDKAEPCCFSCETIQPLHLNYCVDSKACRARVIAKRDAMHEELQQHPEITGQF